MSDILWARWTIVPTAAPEPQLHCRHCGTVRNFASSGKFRLNSNGKKLDAWLIYKCVVCSDTWNRPLLERRSVGALDPAFLNALQKNDRDLADRIAFDVAGLRRRAQRVEEFGGVRVTKTALARLSVNPEAIMIELSVPAAPGLRLDRLLAQETGIARSRIRALLEEGCLRIEPEGARAMRKQVRDGTRIVISGVEIDPACIAG